MLRVIGADNWKEILGGGPKVYREDPALESNSNCIGAQRQSRPAEGIEEVASASHYGRDVTPAPGAEAEVPEIEDVVLPWEVRGGDAEEGHSPREELLAGELQELTIRDGIAVVMEGIAEEAEEEAGAP